MDCSKKKERKKKDLLDGELRNSTRDDPSKKPENTCKRHKERDIWVSESQPDLTHIVHHQQQLQKP